ncbi:MAG: hypothetical protein FKY71_07745 [Spiribacter salinus]|uniref:Uncharacterized protein n=1 Tax=Spiribacter salinus TaxID=1335746 RepID=A0A540VS73_9GAMM|nr:MAG: hypothetical protein FKY71_07745 [Spiribacter salinus]
MDSKRDKKRPEAKREAPISYRPPAALREEFRARVEKSGLSASAFLTRCWYGGRPPRASRRPPAERKELARLLAEAAKIRTRLYRIAPDANATNGADDHAEILEQIRDELAEIRAALMTAMERKP